jgi:hypothetical protein
MASGQLVSRNGRHSPSETVETRRRAGPCVRALAVVEAVGGGGGALPLLLPLLLAPP